MEQKVRGEQPFQVLSTSFTISPSSSGYDLYFSADGREYTNLFTVGAGVNRQVTQVAAGSYYLLFGNTDEVTINWILNCESGSGGGGGGYVLPPATQNTLGGVKIGSGVTVASDGTISVEGGGGGDYIVVDQLSDITDPYNGMLVYVKYKRLNGWAIDASQISEGYVANIHYDGTEGTRVQVYRSSTSFFWGWHNDATDWTWGQNIWYKIDTQNGIFYCACEDPNAYVDNLDPSATSAATAAEITIDKLYMYDGNEWVEKMFAPREYYINNMNNSERAALFNEISTLLRNNNDSINIPVLLRNYKFYAKYIIDGQRWGEVFFSNFEGGDIWLIGCKPTKLTFPFDMYRIGVILHPDGTVDYDASTISMPSIPYFLSVSFGNEDIGGLSFNTSTGEFTLGGVDYASGDTTTPVQDVYDYLLVINGLLTRAGEYDDGAGTIYKCINVHTLTITDNGEDITLTSPVISAKGITSYTVDDIEFNREITFDYGAWKLVMDVAESNVGINLRMQHS